MDTLTLGGTIVGILAAVAGIVAAVVQVREYLEKRRKKPDRSDQEDRPVALSPAPQVPHNLPPRREFVGREAEKARVHEALRSRYPLTSIDGIGGIGKTVLALEVAHECLHASRGDDPTDDIATFDGLIWATAKDRDLTLNSLLDAVARTLDYPGIAQQPVEEKRDAVRKLLQGKQYLLVVDNFETITDEGVRDFLLELPEPSKALITTREQKLRRVWAISLKGLTESEALTLIRSEGRRLGLAGLELAGDQVLLHVYQATGGAPLAIKWAVGQIKQRGQSLDMVLAALHEARVDIFDNIFARSWNLLSGDARRVLTVMPLFATSASREAIKAASDVRHFALDDALGQLVEMSLVDAINELDLARRRYGIHPLTRAFASARLQSEPKTRLAAEKRLAEFIRGFTRDHGGFWNLEGFAELEVELPNILNLIRWCWRLRLVDPGLPIYNHTAYFLVNRGYWGEAMALGQEAVELAVDAGDELGAARLRVWPVGWIHRHRGSLEVAQQQVEEALAVLEQHDDDREIAFAKRGLGRIAHELGELDRAEQLLGEALEFYESVASERHIYLVTGNLAAVALERDELETAWRLCSELLEPARRFGDPERIAQLLALLGEVSFRRGNLAKAKAAWEEALEYSKRANRLDAIADFMLGLAKVEMGTGQYGMAGQTLHNALDIYQRLNIKSSAEEAKSLIAELSQPPGNMMRDKV